MFLTSYRKETILENIIIKYLTDSISDEELIQLKNWVKDSENKEKFKSFVKSNQELNLSYKNHINVLSAYENIEKVIIPKKVFQLRKVHRVILKYAAVAIITISTFFGLYTSSDSNAINHQNQISLKLADGTIHYLDKNNNTEIKNKDNIVIAHLENDKLVYAKFNDTKHKPTNHELKVPNGKIFKLVLSDGTSVTVNSGSLLKYDDSFYGSEKRNVFLDGEAYFDVVKNKKSPFIVQTNDMNIRVLGTKFNVSSYLNDNNTSVVLEEGSVSVHKASEIYDPEKSVVIKPNQQIVIQKEELIIKEVSIDKYVSWKSRKLLFKNDKFEDIVKKLERYYNISININSSQLNNNRYTGTFTTETISEVLDIFKELSEFKYIVKGDNVSITSISN